MSLQPNSQKHENSTSTRFPQIVKSRFWSRIRQQFWLLSRSLLGHYRLTKMLYGFVNSQALYVCAKLGVADHLSQGAKSCEELATELNVNVNGLCHLMRLLSKGGIVTVDKNGYYKLTSLGSYLRSNTPNSLQGTVLSIAEIYPAWGNLLYSIQTNKAAFDKTFQMNFYDYLHQNVEANTNFNRSMEETTREWIIPTLDMCDLSTVKTVVDVGGNTGMLTAMILKKYPHLQAILFDQEHVVSEAGKILESAQVASRCQVIGGDFFESIPAGGDLYIISRVLLNWDDAHALKILKNCRAAMSHSAKLLIMDFVLPNKDASAYEYELVASLQILVMVGGRLMRTEEEYYDLLSKAGFQSQQLIKTGGMFRFIEAIPA
jgi:SAM-dependent methyltransferase